MLVRTGSVRSNAAISIFKSVNIASLVVRLSVESLE